jgi:hypothetical protein
VQAAPGFVRLEDGAAHSITLAGDRAGRLLISAGDQSQELGLPTLAAFTAPTAADDATRQIDLVAATEAPIHGVCLRCTAAAVKLPASPVPVLLDHANTVMEMAATS